MHCVTRLLLGTLLLCCAANARAALVANPVELEFPFVVLGNTSAPQFVTLSNSGNTMLNVVDLSPVGGAYARAGGSCGAVPFTLVAQASCTLGYTFTPFFIGRITATLRATPDVGDFADFKLVGEGIEGGLSSDPGQLNFPLQVVGDTVGPLNVTLSNTANTSVTVVSLTPASGDYARVGGSCGDVPFTLASNASCTLGYTFSPTGVGTVYQSLRATPNAGDHVDFTLAGEADVGHLTVQPRNIRFMPPITVGQISQESFFTLENTGRVRMQVLSIEPFPVPTVASFVRSGGSCPTPPFTLNAFNTCTVGYVFAPAAAGELTMDVDIENTVASAPSVTLSGLALPAGNEVFGDGFEP